MPNLSRSRLFMLGGAAVAIFGAAGFGVGTLVSSDSSASTAKELSGSTAASAVAMPGMTMPGASTSAASPGTATASAPVFLAATLSGGNEVQTPGGPKVGDLAGSGHVTFRIQGSQLAFALSWKGISAPTAGHIHIGPVGLNGGVQVPLFTSAVPNGVTVVTGAVTVNDSTLLARLRTQPDAFYANLHTAGFPGGAIRGQLEPAPAQDLNAELHQGPLFSIDSGAQEIPSTEGATGDPDGLATAFVQTTGNDVGYSFEWTGLTRLTAGHIHHNGVGQDGPVVIPLFQSPAGVPAGITGLAGRVSDVNPALISQIRQDPSAFYTNLHTAQFPAGAVRGQLTTPSGL